jgi:hypothetical protein
MEVDRPVSSQQEPAPEAIATAAVADITARWHAAATAISSHPDLPGALRASGLLGEGVRGLYDREAKPLRGRQVRRIRAAGGGSLRKLEQTTALSRSVLADLEATPDPPAPAPEEVPQ